MGYYSEYLDRGLNQEQLSAERKVQLKRISKIRDGRDILVIAADLNKADAQTSINYSDLLPVSDQLSNLSGKSVDLILETGGGSGEVAEDIVKLLRGKYGDTGEVGVIVPGWAKSAGTIIAMAADEILMEPASALGPIDAQILWQGKVFSADALIEGLEKIKKEVEKANQLNKAYIPILQGISPGEIQNAENALKFAKRLVTDWLVQYKFKNWTKHSSTGAPVTPEERTARAEDIARQLGDHRRCLTHGRSIKIDDLQNMKLLVTDYSKIGEWADAIRRYHTLLQMTFASNIYKIFETPSSQILRVQVQSTQLADPTKAGAVDIDAVCGTCNATLRVQANLEDGQQMKPGFLPFPKNNLLRCPTCGNEIDLTGLRQQLEAQTQKTIK